MNDATTGRRRAYAPRMAPEDRREHLLDAVLTVIVDHGVHKVSIETVAEAAHVSRPVVYKHFEDSAALLRASLAREEARAIAQCYDAARRARTQGGQDDVALALYANLLDMFTDSPDLWRAILQLVDSATPAFRLAVDRGREQAAAIAENVLTTDTPDDGADHQLYARMIVAMVIESGRLLLTRPDTFTKDRLISGASRAIHAYQP
ncbi:MULTISPECIES: TetR/AcrR family transcriptional regulator [Tsukamurella]|nr:MULTISPECIES: TetR/AcrR family transcriptional regulator [Tsukamurella]NMD54136.1 TetR/AcrR family transcriptional regulator [Tsukamurella columbiensis]